MKLLTLNTHSLAEPDYEKKLRFFGDLVIRERPAVMALQEVNQTISSPPLKAVPPESGYRPCGGFDGPIRQDNHAWNLARILREGGLFYHWTWIPAKLGYDIYEEGLALFSLEPIEDTEQFFISQSQSFTNWKTRRIAGIQAGGQWFYSVHMGWWADEEEPFACHWDRVREGLKRHLDRGTTVWIMGDFNSPDDKTGQGYDYVKASGWLDTYDLAEEKDRGITVGQVIDGWRQEGRQQPGMRIDYIWCGHKVPVQKSEVICDGEKDPVVSDHYGVMATI